MPEPGICQWFHHQDRETLRRTVALLRELGIRRLRTGISWADWYRPDGPAWVDEVMESLDGFELLVSVWHTPPSISEGGACSSPPRRLRDYADFIDVVISRYGRRIAALELWNEPNNRYKWDFPAFDPQWAKFAEMVGAAAYWAKQRGVTTVLGGMIPVDTAWLELMERAGVLAWCDAIAFHGFPGMWWDDHPNWEWHRDWRGWEDKAEQLRPLIGGRELWVTETGLATWSVERAREERLAEQGERLAQALRAPVDRLFWYSLIDLDPARAAIEGFHVDEHEYHLGLVRHDGSRKPAFARLQALLRGQDATAIALQALP